QTTLNFLNDLRFVFRKTLLNSQTRRPSGVSNIDRHEGGNTKMHRKFFYLASAFSLIVLFGFQSKVRADDWDQKTRFSINRPVSISGQVVLPAGTYIIKRLSAINPVVQVLDATETKVYATVLTIPDVVTDPPDKPMFTFEETSEGNPPALKTWYYPGYQTA